MEDQEDVPAYGQEDPRWISVHPETKEGSNRLFVMSSSKRLGRIYLFLRQVFFNHTHISYGTTLELKPMWNTKSHQKNWMYIPLPLNDAEVRKLIGLPLELDVILFIYYTTPSLNVAFVSVQDGSANILNSIRVENLPSKIVDHLHLKGSSALLELPAKELNKNELYAWISIVHTTEVRRLDWNKYNNYFIRFALIQENNMIIFKATHLSKQPWVLPTSKGSMAMRITFPTTINRFKDSYFISMGEMDCTSHIIQVSHEFIFKNLQHLYE